MARRGIKTDVASSIPVDDGLLPYEADDVQEALENQAQTGVSRYSLIYGYNGNASNKWLELFPSVPSDTSPFVVAEVGTIEALSVAVRNTSTATFTLYVNGISVDTISLTAATTNSKILTTPISLSINDEISAKITSGSANNIIFSVNIKVT